MRVFISIKYHADHRNQDVIQRISCTLEKQGITTRCIIRDVEHWGTSSYNAHDLMRITFEEIDQSDIVIVDLTEKGVGVGIEAGYAYAKNKPIITIAKDGSEISETLKGISSKIITYVGVDEIDQLFAQIRLQ